MITLLFHLVVSTPILNILVGVYAFLGDFGATIVALTLLVWMALSPLTILRIVRGTTNKQDIQSQVEEIRRKQGLDDQVREKALQAILRQHVIGTLTGCLTTLLRIIVLIGLYSALSDLLSSTTLVDINNQLYPFVPHFHQLPNLNLNWFTFLNPAWHQSLALPDQSHTLPIIAGIFTAVQVRLQIAITKGALTLRLERAVILHMCIATLLTVLFSWFIASGVVLHWVTIAAIQGTLDALVLLRQRSIRTPPAQELRIEANGQTGNEGEEKPTIVVSETSSFQENGGEHNEHEHER